MLNVCDKGGREKAEKSYKLFIVFETALFSIGSLAEEIVLQILVITILFCGDVWLFR